MKTKRKPDLNSLYAEIDSLKEQLNLAIQLVEKQKVIIKERDYEIEKFNADKNTN